VGKHSAWGERYRTYDAGPVLATLESEGIPAGSPIYKAMQSVVSSTPKPKTVAVGRLVDDFDQTSTLTVLDATEGAVIAFDVRAPNGGAVTSISYTVLAAATTTTVAAALALLIDAITDISSTSAVAVITNTADNPNEMWQFEGIDSTQLSFVETTIDSTLATEVGQIDVLYPSWYGLILADPNSNARAVALAAWVETREKIFGVTSFDHDNGQSGSTMFALEAAGYNRTFTMFSNDQNSRAAAAWMGGRFAIDAGSQTWAYKALPGVTVDTLTSTFETSIFAVNGNTYTVIGGLSNTNQGKMASGEWIDAIRGRDWFTAEVRANVFGVLANATKVPFTDKGVQMVVKEVKAAQTAGIAAGFLAADPEPFVTFPLVADVSDANKIARILPDVYFEQTLAGAIHIVNLTGRLLV
jgi:hypothetical protein